METTPHLVVPLLLLLLVVLLLSESLVSQTGPGGPYEDTLLLLLSDHGQTQGGDHGGGTHDETDSVLVAFNLRDMKLQRDKQQPAEDLSNSANNSDIDKTSHPSSSSISCSEDGNSDGDDLLLHRLMGVGGYLDPRSPSDLQQQYPHLVPGPWCCNSSVSQIDLTPLMAYLLGVAIPFGNLGKIPPHLFKALTVDRDGGLAVQDSAEGQPGGSSAGTPASWLLQYADALRANADQVIRGVR